MKKFIIAAIAFIGAIYFIPKMLGYGVVQNPSGSMRPTIEIGSYILVDWNAFNDSMPETNDLVLFKYSDNPNESMIGRAIGLPDETVKIENGITYVSGKAIEQSYIQDSFNTHHSSLTFPEITIPSEGVFVMGDARDLSNDSRYKGPVRAQNVIGKIIKVF
ncbi:MAG: signal peptidase I [Candidatus Endonucleobacter sp. (ex Gigantidas childressi)]|nr:signal peptidase I [Candidatus Endonucleobacter sp. (ex Gigantidas childressi)]